MTYPEYILGELDEARQTLLFALDGLSADDLTSMEPCGHWPIAWIAMHLTMAMDNFVNFELTGEYTIEHDERMKHWPMPEPQQGDPWPPLETLVTNWNTVMDKAIENVKALGEDGLQKVGGHLKREGWDYPISTVLWWMVKHHHQHMRMLWTILGERRVDDKWDEPEMPE